MNVNHSTPQNPAIQKRIGPGILMGLGVLFLLVGIGWLGLNWWASTQPALTVPDTLAGMSISNRLSGDAALQNIARLHGKTFPITDGVVAMYNGHDATVWISSTWLPVMAQKQVTLMTERIKEGQSPFNLMGHKNVAGLTVFELTGLGQTHYYFQRNRQVVWLAVNPELAQQSLTELIDYLQ